MLAVARLALRDFALGQRCGGRKAAARTAVPAVGLRPIVNLNRHWGSELAENLKRYDYARRAAW